MTYEKKKGAAKRNISKAMLRAIALERNACRSDISELRRRQLRLEAKRLRQNDAAARELKKRREL